VINDGEFSVK